MIIGQSDFPVLLGAALLSYSLRKEKCGMSLAGFATFQADIGGCITILLYIFACRKSFGSGH